ncbi:MAG: tetratricopeptide repeat protein [Treponema sp.]|nr:tetratricopeptide repeat protein [Spirochaetales bacterium]MDY4902370.1 tetratricopeptide repeat protein [Treponema sp.]
MLKKNIFTAAALLCFAFLSCSVTSEQNKSITKEYIQTQKSLAEFLEKDDLSQEARFAVVNKIATNMLSVKDYNSLTLFLTEWVENHPQDPYNAYWLLMTAYAYLETDSKPVAEYYFERIINNYDDLMINENSIHFLCLQHLIQISTVPANRISYFTKLISKFPGQISLTESYYRLALEYEKEGEWTLALKTYNQFLEQDDAFSIQIAGIPNAYLNARQLIDFNNSPKDWTFESLDALVSAVKTAISNYNYRALDKYKSKVNFFAMSWRQDETDSNAQQSFSMHDYMNGQRIRYSPELDSSSTPNEAYLRTWGWSTYINVWYLYFRKVNFPADPDIHGRWEWAGIYYGEKL